jgi:hypothetical protein
MGKAADHVLDGVLAVNGNPTMLDLGNIPAILNIDTNASLELRDLLMKNVATQKDLQSYKRPPNDNLTTVYGLLTWPSFYGQAGANLRIYNTTQYFWSYTLFRRGDCNYLLTTPAPQQQPVCERHNVFARLHPLTHMGGPLGACQLPACVTSVPCLGLEHL